METIFSNPILLGDQGEEIFRNYKNEWPIVIAFYSGKYDSHFR